MKIIDLLNKIANGEEIPKRITYKGQTLDYEDGIDYKDYLNAYLFEHKCCITKEDLNEEVEIIEEEKKIPEKLTTLYLANSNQTIQDDILYKINEIIDYLEYLKSKGGK